MASLVIVESPAKAKTIKKYLGKNYVVMASMGHLRDLPKNGLGVDIENNFTPEYKDIKDKGDLIKSLKKEAKGCESVYLATDPDREGEAISWHLANMLGLDLAQKNRVTFNEITKTGVTGGMKSPRQIDVSLVDSQQARRILDRIVGYKISPFLWKKVRYGLSAGRVQSVAVKLIVDRENEIRAFVPEEYWSIGALLNKLDSDKSFTAEFYGLDGAKPSKLKLTTKAETDEVLKKLKGAKFTVKEVKLGVRKKSPAPPFITSTLQQEASRRFGFQSRRTMKAAQELYEGIDLKDLGATGLITYMRTDSLRISDEAANEAKDYILDTYGANYYPAKRRVFKSRASAQDAHEAIRPSSPSLTPDMVKGDLSADQFKIYKLIWDRFVASQMAEALYDTVSAGITANGYLFRASGFTVKFNGFTVLYEEQQDEETEKGEVLPGLKEGEELGVKSLKGEQHFTVPPPRYTEATIIKALEENGIGRPSTYAPTITTILAREYVEREAKQLKPTALGEVITKLMDDYFKSIVNVRFTANMENELDEIASGSRDWKKTLAEFYGDFAATLSAAEEQLKDVKIKVPDEETDIICELCGRKMVIKSGRFGKFLACPGYPECKNTKKITKETGGLCPLCGGKMLEKKSKNKKTYYGCEHNPKCSFMSWDIPLAENCPQCGSALFQKKGRGAKIYCAKEGCGYERKAGKK